MSQQINLYNPALKKRRDWLSLPVLVVGFFLSFISVTGLWLYASREAQKLESARQAGDAQLKDLQTRFLAFSRTLGDRKADPAIAKEAEALLSALNWRQEALQMLESGANDKGAVAGYMRGFARQASDGIWLTGFKITEGQLEIHGRLLDPSLLPAYIRRLNNEPTLRGHKFAALDMKVGEPDAEKVKIAGTAATPEGSKPPVLKYVDFALLSSPLPSVPKTGTGN